MTIAIGMCCNKGVLIGADTEHTGEMKTNAGKIFTEFRQKDGSGLALAFAGSVPFAHMFIDIATTRYLNLKKRTSERIVEQLRSDLAEFCRTHIYPHPNRQMAGGPDFQLLIGVRGIEEKCSLYSSYDTAIFPQRSFDCIGVGAPLARYLIIEKHSIAMNLRDAHPLMRRALNQAKKYVPYCGGPVNLYAYLHPERLGEFGFNDEQDTSSFPSEP